MTRIKILVDKQHHLAGFVARGHAAFVDDGPDVVCAMISVLLQTAVAGLTDCAGLQPVWSRRNGYLLCKVATKDRNRNEVRVLLGSIRLALEEIARQHPSCVAIEEKLLQSRNRGRTSVTTDESSPTNTDRRSFHE